MTFCHGFHRFSLQATPLFLHSNSTATPHMFHSCPYSGGLIKNPQCRAFTVRMIERLFWECSLSGGVFVAENFREMICDPQGGSSISDRIGAIDILSKSLSCKSRFFLHPNPSLILRLSFAHRLTWICEIGLFDSVRYCCLFVLFIACL